MCKLKPRTRNTAVSAWIVTKPSQCEWIQTSHFFCLISSKAISGLQAEIAPKNCKEDPSSGNLSVLAIYKRSEVLFWNVCLGPQISNPSWTFVLGSESLNFPLIFPKVVTFLWSLTPGSSRDNVLCRSSPVWETERYWGISTGRSQEDWSSGSPLRPLFHL